MDGIYEIIAELRLRDRKAKLMIDLDEIRSVEKEFLMIRKHYTSIWHMVKDPILKRELHKEINKLDALMYMYISEPKRKILEELRATNIVLDKKESIYDCGYCPDLHYDKIERFGIKGTRV